MFLYMCKLKIHSYFYDSYLNQDQAHKLTVELLEDEEGDIFSDMEDGTSL